MGITSRKVRPLKRTPEVPKVRDARLVVIAAEDTYAAKQYFESDLFHSSRIQIEVLETPNSDEAGNKKQHLPPAKSKLACADTSPSMISMMRIYYALWSIGIAGRIRLLQTSHRRPFVKNEKTY